MKKILKNKKILIGITGGIAAYKVPEIVRRLLLNEAEVKVVFTENGARFVSKYTLEILTGGKVYSDMFSGGIQHIQLAEESDLIVIIPATYNIIGKIANGVADDLLTTIIAASKKNKILFPSMNTAMLENPILLKNIDYLKSLGYEIVEPTEGALACGTSGKGRLPDTDIVIFHISRVLADNSFKGKRILITAGSTCEKIDPVRMITNASSGRMGVELSKTFTILGGDVLLLMGRHSVNIPPYINVKYYSDSEELYSLVMNNIKNTDIIIMAAAVSDFKPEFHSKKIKRNKKLTIKLIPTVDILKEVSKIKEDRLIVGFCLEDETNIVEEGLRKMKEKNCDIMIANTIDSIGSDITKGYLIYKKNEEYYEMTKEELSWRLTNIIKQYYI